MKKVCTLIAAILLLAGNVHAHDPRTSFFTINSEYIAPYTVSLYVPGTTSYGIPEYISPQKYLVNQLVNFSVFPNRLSYLIRDNFIPPEVLNSATFTWYFGDGAKDQGTSVTHTYKTQGSHLVTIRADFEHQAGIRPKTIATVLLHILPTETYRLPHAVIRVNNSSVPVPQKKPLILDINKDILFEASSSASSEPVSEYAWSLVEPRTRYEQKLTHKFVAVSGEVKVPVLRVRDKNGFLSYTGVTIGAESGIVRTVEVPRKLQDFTTLYLSIIIESFPFVIIGVIVSVLVALFVSEKFILKYLPKNRFTSHLMISCLGIFVPVCQCGNVPVARRLIQQGFTVSQAVTFLLAAPIVNGITFLTTWEAFGPDHSIAVIRLLAGFCIAYAIGIYVSYRNDQESYLTKEFSDHCHTDSDHRPSLSYALDIFQSEFILIMKVLCIGAFVAAVTQVFAPKEAILAIGQNAYLSILAMLLLGFVISICSTVDAFFALTYINRFTAGSILTFLIFGPLVDIKMLFMLKTTFKGRVLVAITLFVAVISSVVGLLVNHFHP